MRKFNSFEKSIIDRIVDYHKRGILSNYASIIDHLLQNKDIALDYNTRSAELHADVQYYQAGQLAGAERQPKISEKEFKEAAHQTDRTMLFVLLIFVGLICLSIVLSKFLSK